MRRWQYRTFDFASLEDLNRLGQDGWELVGFWHDAAYFKRPNP